MPGQPSGRCCCGPRAAGVRREAPVAWRRPLGVGGQAYTCVCLATVVAGPARPRARTGACARRRSSHPGACARGGRKVAPDGRRPEAPADLKHSDLAPKVVAPRRRCSIAGAAPKWARAAIPISRCSVIAASGLQHHGTSASRRWRRDARRCPRSRSSHEARPRPHARRRRSLRAVRTSRVAPRRRPVGSRSDDEGPSSKFSMDNQTPWATGKYDDAATEDERSKKFLARPTAASAWNSGPCRSARRSRCCGDRPNQGGPPGACAGRRSQLTITLLGVVVRPCPAPSSSSSPRATSTRSGRC